jgi:1-pyrroline-5-carboxylate dehydrogenase
VLADPDLAGIHFTGSTRVFQQLWRTVGPTSPTTLLPAARRRDRRQGLRGRAPSADPDVLRTALVRGAFEYQGQKCSAASRAYVPRHLWQVCATTPRRHRGADHGDVTDLSNFMGAVIDDRAFAGKAAIDRAEPTDVTRARRRHLRRQRGLLRPADRAAVRPTRRRDLHAPSTSARSCPCTSTTTPTTTTMLVQMESAAPYALTGSIIAQDRAAVADRERSGCGSRRATSTSTTSRPARSSGSSRSAAPRVGHQRQGRLAAEPPALDQSPRSIKETFVPPTHRVRLAGNGSAGLPQAHRGRLHRIRGFRRPHPAVQGRLRRAGLGGLP